MTNSEMLAAIQKETGESDVDLLFDLLNRAKRIALTYLYPFDLTRTTLPVTMDTWLVRATIELYNKRGVEGQTSHSENGVSRGYDSSGLSKGLLQELTPKVKVI